MANAFTVSVPRVEARVLTRSRKGCRGACPHAHSEGFAAGDSESVREQADRLYN
jgi:hypothetical protein